MSKIDRRRAIKTLGGLAGAAVGSKWLTACGGSDPAPEGITTIVAVMMENRSYDHYLGARSLVEGLGGDGLVSGMSNKTNAGADVLIHPATDMQCVEDPPHGWASSRQQFANGANDGFIKAHEDRHGAAATFAPMSYMQRADVPVTNALADNYVSCDRWFSSLMTSTWPNRMYWFAGTSFGQTGNTRPSMEGPTIFDQLDDIGVDWGFYFSDLPTIAIIPWIEFGDRLNRLNDFFNHAAAGTLPAVTYVEPAFSYNDDHPPHHPLLGQQFLASIYQACAESPQWNNMLIVVTYDEHGGFFDHVPPPTAPDDMAADGFDQLGFRVPSLVLGPYTKQNYVSSVQYDHTSMLAQISDMHGTPSLSTRQTNANTLVDCIDWERMMNNDPAPPIELPAVEVDESMLDPACMEYIPGDVEKWADSGAMDAKWDYRKSAKDVVFDISDYLDKRGLGRIRKGK